MCLAKLAASGAEEEASFNFLLEAVKNTDPKGRQLAAQFIPQFFKLFSESSEKAINAQIGESALPSPALSLLLWPPFLLLLLLPTSTTHL